MCEDVLNNKKRGKFEKGVRESVQENWHRKKHKIYSRSNKTQINQGVGGLAQLLVDGKKEGLAPPVPIIERPTDQKVRGSNPLPRAKNPTSERKPGFVF